MDNTTFYANPYSLSHTGFFFHDLAGYEAGRETLNRLGCEEWEIDYIDGPDAQLFEACGTSQADIGVWFDDIQGLDDHEKVSLYYLTEYSGYSLPDALSELEDCSVFEGTAKEYAEEYVDSCGLLDSMPEQLQAYFDYESFARDLQYGGDVYEFQFSGTTYTANR